MNRKIIIAVLSFILPMGLMAQGNWERPVTQQNTQNKEIKEKPAKTKKAIAEEKYMVKNAVPEVDGKVEWVMDFDVPGSTAQSNYDKMLAFLNDFVKEKNQLEESNVSIVNKQEYKIAASIREWLVFNSNFFSIDRTQFQYTLLVECFDNHVNVTMSRLKYFYDERPNKTTVFKAEELIIDKEAMNKAKTKLVRPGAKFRRKTIDRKDEVFDKIKACLTGNNG